jgi:hypothetical protein
MRFLLRQENLENFIGRIILQPFTILIGRTISHQHVPNGGIISQFTVRAIYLLRYSPDITPIRYILRLKVDLINPNLY